MSKRSPGLGSLLMGAAWSVRLKLIAAAVVLVGTGFAGGWVYRWVTEPLVPPEPVASASISPVASTIPSPAPSKPTPRGQTLYVLNARGTITEYPSGSGGDIEPSAIISGELTGLPNYPKGIALDRHGNIYVATADSVLEYSAGSSGNVAPALIIHGPATHLYSPTAISVDPNGNVYVSGYNGVLEFSAGSSGDTAPVAIVSRDTIRNLGNPVFASFGAVASDSHNDLLLRCCYNGTVLATLHMASGEVVSTLSGSLTGLEGSGGIALDSAGSVWAANYGGLMKYPAGSAGNVKPTNLIYGPATHYSAPGALAVDGKRNVYVASGYPGSVAEYSSDATGNISAIAVLSGSDTRLEGPVGIAIGP